MLKLKLKVDLELDLEREVELKAEAEQEDEVEVDVDVELDSECSIFNHETSLLRGTVLNVFFQNNVFVINFRSGLSGYHCNSNTSLLFQTQ